MRRCRRCCRRRHFRIRPKEWSLPRMVGGLHAALRTSTRRTPSARSPTSTRWRATTMRSANGRAELLIVAEAQRIKEWGAQAAGALQRIDALRGIVRPGTPMQNRLDQPSAIVRLIDRYPLGPTWRRRHDHQILGAARPASLAATITTAADTRSRRSCRANARPKCGATARTHRRGAAAPHRAAWLGRADITAADDAGARSASVGDARQRIGRHRSVSATRH